MEQKIKKIKVLCWLIVIIVSMIKIVSLYEWWGIPVLSPVKIIFNVTVNLIILAFIMGFFLEAFEQGKKHGFIGLIIINLYFIVKSLLSLPVLFLFGTYLSLAVNIIVAVMGVFVISLLLSKDIKNKFFKKDKTVTLLNNSNEK